MIWRPDFPYQASKDAWIEGWSRQFWQGSTDHRGVPGAPGRVATLVEEAGARCWGRVYKVDEEVLAHLDRREQGGYSRHVVMATTWDEREIEGVIVWIGGPTNPNWLGRAPLGEMVAQILESEGPSGSNVEYLMELDQALSRMGADDAAVAGLAEAVRRYKLKQGRKAARRKARR